MNSTLILDNLLSPPILFFFLGMIAAIVRSNLEIPQPLSRFLSLYLLFCIGFKGGVELRSTGFNQDIAFALMAALFMASVVPVYTFFILRLKLGVHDAAAIAATYGSVSAVTFITASSFLQQLGIGFGGYLVAAMALMESPAIIIGGLLNRLFSRSQRDQTFSWPELVKDGLLNGSVFLIMGSLLIGLSTGAGGSSSLKPFSEDIFRGMLTFFLLDMGLIAGKRIRDLGNAGAFLGLFSVAVPLVNATAGILLAKLIGLSIGDALMFTVLAASASYIAVPAAMRLCIPEANPSLYVPMALAITFPFNIILGLPLYMFFIRWLWS